MQMKKFIDHVITAIMQAPLKDRVKDQLRALTFDIEHSPDKTWGELDNIAYSSPEEVNDYGRQVMEHFIPVLQANHVPVANGRDLDRYILVNLGFKGKVSYEVTD